MLPRPVLAAAGGIVGVGMLTGCEELVCWRGVLQRVGGIPLILVCDILRQGSGSDSEERSVC